MAEISDDVIANRVVVVGDYLKQFRSLVSGCFVAILQLLHDKFTVTIILVYNYTMELN